MILNDKVGLISFPHGTSDLVEETSQNKVKF